ncbi:hypothetical protein B0I35DRAFT_446566 [Stachybotrys elegans]|uniref:Uncharacterized protein n=1 Tax=Stachybotrys elegans TaxID=80388 RepID=A0A8K0SDM4_9HYPO|nr:hypothetical protein B0I35DRAFT_446566 [Stachybotrys elegans]
MVRFLSLVLVPAAAAFRFTNIDDTRRDLSSDFNITWEREERDGSLVDLMLITNQGATFTQAMNLPTSDETYRVNATSLNNLLEGNAEWSDDPEVEWAFQAQVHGDFTGGTVEVDSEWFRFEGFGESAADVKQPSIMAVVAGFTLLSAWLI